MKIKSIKKVILDSPKQYYDVIDATPFHNFFIKTDSGYVVSHNCNFTDEVNFGLTSDVEKLKKKQKQLISQIDARMASRFLRGNYLPTLNIIASSKNSDQSFLEDYIDNKRKNNSTTTLIVDEPQWVVDSRKDSDKHFYVAIGNRELANELLPMDADEQMANTYRDKGYKIYEVPSGYREKFEDNLDSSITDIIGIATQSGMKYISGVRWKEAKTASFQNPFTKETIECGTGKDDTSQYSDYFDLTKIPEEVKSMPLFIHLDMSQGNNGLGDKTGIAGVFITGKKPKIEGEDSSKELFFRLGFHVGIKAPKGQSISFDKHRTFIRWLRNKGFKIKGVSSDTYQNGQLSQQLIADGFDYKVISVDRLDTESKIQLQYAYFKSTLYDRRIEIYDNCKELTEEVLGLERESDGHINHPNNGTQGCFTGDTKISLVDGREVSLLQLVDEFNQGKQNYVYSFNEVTKKIEPKLIEKAWCTIKNASLVQVELDNGEKIRCTPNHRFMLRDGIYKQAKDLKENDSLMPLYRKYLTEEQSPLYEYRLYYEPIENEWHYEHRRFCNEYFSNSKEIVHHKNCNKKDNTPSNLIYCSRREHQNIHNSLSNGAHSPEANLKRSVSMTKWHENNKNTNKYKERSKKLHDANLKQHNRTENDYQEHQNKLIEQHLRGEEIRRNAENRKREKENYINSMERFFNIKWENLTSSERDAYSVKYKRYLDPSIQERITQGIKNNHKKGKYLNANIALEKCNAESKRLKELYPIIDRAKFLDIFGFEYDSIEKNKKAAYATKYRKILDKSILNHKVKEVKFIENKEDVYDLTIQDNHNFALSAGVFVHNSKDMIDGVVGSLWNASQHADQFAFDYGESLDLMQKVSMESSTNSANQKQQVKVQFEDELKKLFTGKYAPPSSTKVDTTKNTTDTNNTKQDNSNNNNQSGPFLDFGVGPAQTYQPQYTQNGIILW